MRGCWRAESCERRETGERERSIISGLWVEFTWLGFFLEEEGWMESDRDA